MRRIVWLVEAFVLGGIAALAAANLIRGPLEGPAMAAPSVAALDVVISEVAWMGTQAGDSDEWIELCNTTDQDISLIGWQLTSSDGTPTVGLTGTIPAHGYYLLERTDDDTVSDIPADQIYTGDLLLAGEVLTLTNGLVTIIDTANGANGGVWPAGSNNPDHTMERIDPASPDTDDNWCTNGGVVRNGLDSAGDPINGTPKAQNSCYQPPVKPAADLAIIKTGPLTTSTGALITYQIALSNTGTITATGVRVTDTLPIATTFITQTSPFTFTFSQVDGVLVWDVGDVLTGARHVITLALSIRGVCRHGSRLLRRDDHCQRDGDRQQRGCLVYPPARHSRSAGRGHQRSGVGGPRRVLQRRVDRAVQQHR